ncbi:MAG TPA: cyclic nucleotide-binding domain-containing protein [Kofleriaceae bacterium]|jgi:CRP-like cAMP-binding protein
MARKDSTSLRDEALKAIERGKLDRAIEIYIELEALEPEKPEWPKRLGESYRRNRANANAVSAFERAAIKYVAGGFLVQAIAVCKLILQIDPRHSATIAMLVQLAPGPRPTTPVAEPPAPAVRAPTFGGVEQGVARSPAPATPPTRPSTPPPPMPPAVRPAPPPLPPRSAPPPIPRRATPPATPLRPAAPPLTAIPVTVPAGRALDALDLATVIPGSKRLSTKGGQWTGINVVPLDEPLALIDPPTSVPSRAGAEEIPVEIDAASLLARGGVASSMDEISLEDGEPHGELSLDDATSNDLDPPTAARFDPPTSHRPRAATAAPMRVLSGTPLFSDLSPAVLEMLIPRMKLVVLDPNEVLFTEGEAGDCLYVVSEGEVAVETNGSELARLGPGAFFGEVALVTDQPRSATVRALTRVEALAIDRDVVRDAAAEQPEIVNTLLRFVRERLVDRMTRTSALFQSFTEGERQSLIARFEFLEIAADVHLIVEGQRTDGLYVVVAGVVEVWRDSSTAPLGVLGSGDVFGEMALLGDGAATASCTTASRVIALRMPAAKFREVIMTHPQVLAYLSDIEAARAPRIDGDDVLGIRLELL